MNEMEVAIPWVECNCQVTIVRRNKGLSLLTLSSLKGGIVMGKGMHQSENLFAMSPVQQTSGGANLTGFVAFNDDVQLVELLRAGNESAFVSLIDRYHSTMLRLAMMYVTARTIAE